MIEKIKSILRHIAENGEAHTLGDMRNLDPEFELLPRDYLKYAESSLDKKDPESLINATSHLKRALDCQIDIFLNSFNLYDLVSSRNLSVEKKVEFISSVCLFPTRSLNRLNKIRNKMEHEYQVPEIEDLNVYFDLITAFIMFVEPLSNYPSMLSICYSEDEEEYGYASYLRMEYEENKPTFNCILKNGETTLDEWKINAEEDIAIFAYYLKSFFCLKKVWDNTFSHNMFFAHMDL